MANPYGQYAPGYGGYQSHQGYPPVQQQYNGPPAEFGPPRRSDSYGPPAVGGFQHGQQGQQFGAYGASNPQGHPAYLFEEALYRMHQRHHCSRSDYSGTPYPQGQGQPGYLQHNYGNQPMSHDPNAPEGERGLLGALGGGIAGGYGGSKVGGGHGFLGAIAGAIAGSKLEDAMKHKKHGGYPGSSSWGGQGGRW